MMVLLFVPLFAVLAYFQGKFIRKHNIVLYIVATIISILVFVFQDVSKLTDLLIHGLGGLSFLYLVMLTGALNKKSTLFKKLMGVRREYSIIGFILISPHALNFFIELLSDFEGIKTLFGVVAFVIMIPLFVTSFMAIRTKFSYKTWKALHKWSYLAYILIFIHIILVSGFPNIIAYLVLFVPYFILKIIKEYKLIKKK